MSKTMKEKFIEGLKKLGEVQVKETHKYVVFSRKVGGHYYIGRSGSLRVGHTVQGSIPTSTTFKQLVLSAGVS